MPSGTGAGKPFKLDRFQKRFILATYAEHGVTNNRLVRRAILSIARKNGKTALIAALVLVHLVGPESIQNGEIYSAANDREQAAQVFKVAAQIVRADPELNAMLRIVDSTKTIACLGNGSFYKALSAEAGTKHGLNPSVFIYDELAQSKNRELYDVLDTAQGARHEPLGIVISTQSNDPAHPLSELIDDGLAANDNTIVCHLYAVPDECEDIFDPKEWRKANPALGTFRRLDDFQAMADRAKRLKSFENTFRNLYLNQRVSVMTTLFSKSDWEGCIGEVEFEENEEVILALDFAGTTDLACLGMMSVDGARFKPWFWKPLDMIDEHGKADRVPYRTWMDQGHLNASHGRIIDSEDIAIKIGELAATYNVLGLVYDRWRIEYLKKELERQDLDAREADDADIQLMPWGQGFKDMSPAIEALENLVLANELRHPSNPILNWNVANAVVSTDPAGNRKFDKDKSRMRIDGAQVLAMAAGKRAQLLDENGPSIYEARGALVI
ncbi:terminase large subunit [Maritalea mobilis]|uniref:terminase large subunit n=1 Tax=Maritalea mobilis TaxID=483324 RepID=UPI0024823AE7|nr:terminase TerL endonuclease subunit [Maritalea mobilis]